MYERAHTEVSMLTPLALIATKMAERSQL